jgi:hypothetical protein
MLKKFIQISSMAAALAIASGISASAATGNEEDAAAPAGSFTSTMPAPASPNFEFREHRAHHDRFAMRFANAGDRAMRQDGERQK